MIEVISEVAEAAADIKSSDLILRKENIGKFNSAFESFHEGVQYLKQDKVVFEVTSGLHSLETNAEKGNFGEILTDCYMRQNEYKRISADRITGLGDKGHTGIDGVYYNPKGTPSYIICDAKFGQSQLSATLDGKQMSDDWVLGERLDEAVGKETADTIRAEKLKNPDNVMSCVCKIKDGGYEITVHKIDSNGNITERNIQLKNRN